MDIRRLGFILCTFLLWIGLFILVGPVNALVDITSWRLETTLPFKLASHQIITYKDNLIINAGSAATGNGSLAVLLGKLGSDGILTRWDNFSELPSPVIFHSSVSYLDNLYVIGGYIDYRGSVATVYKSKFADDLTLGPWLALFDLPKSFTQGGAIVQGNRIYYAGGYTGNTTVPSDSIYALDLDENGDPIGDWFEIGKLPLPMWGFGFVNSGSKMVVIGGNSGSGNLKSVWSRDIHEDGSLGDWTTLESLPKEVYRSSVGVVGNYIVSVGGTSNGTYLSDVFYTELDSNHNTGTWVTSANPFPRVNCCSPLAVWRNRLYMTGGHNGNQYFNDVYSTTLGPEVLPTSVPIPTVAPTATPSPTPLPVNKVVLIPGLGASWNTEALFKCMDQGYSGNWGISPSAESIYSPLTTALNSSGLSVIPFYYDWRRDISETVEKLNVFIDQKIKNGEKVHLIGHSFGGLVGRAYVEKYGNSRIEKLFTIGSPHLGTPISYPTWAAGESVGNDLLWKMAQTIVFKVCRTKEASDLAVVHNRFPSIGNLLPTFDYLKFSNSFIDINKMINKNTWIKTSFVQPFGGVVVGTLSGQGENTTLGYEVKTATKNQIKNSLWLDGKTKKELRTKLGDGAIMQTSSSLDGADNYVIQGTHNGIVASNEGINKVLTFLGKTGINQQIAFIEPDSLLLLVGENADVEISGAKSTDKSVVSVVNPHSGKYRLTIKPNKLRSKYTIARFDYDGTTSWQEITLSGLGVRNREIVL